MAATEGRIRAGIGGWTYEPWRDNFYPKGLPHARELEYACRHVTAIEINGTFYRTQKPETFAKWRDETPSGFTFAVKAPRYATIRKVLGEAGPSIERFVESGLAELGPRLGPILWQFAPTKRFEPEDFEAFLKLLPAKIGARKARHALEPRHASFIDPQFVALARRYRCAIVFTDSDEYPAIGDVTADFVSRVSCARRRISSPAIQHRRSMRGRRSRTLSRVEPSLRSFPGSAKRARSPARAMCTFSSSTARKSARRPQRALSSSGSDAVERTVGTRSAFAVSGGTALQRSAVANIALETAVTGHQNARDETRRRGSSGRACDRCRSRRAGRARAPEP